jgi:hypothetical protein
MELFSGWTKCWCRWDHQLVPFLLCLEEFSGCHALSVVFRQLCHWWSEEEHYWLCLLGATYVWSFVTDSSIVEWLSLIKFLDQSYVFLGKPNFFQKMQGIYWFVISTIISTSLALLQMWRQECLRRYLMDTSVCRSTAVILRMLSLHSHVGLFQVGTQQSNFDLCYENAKEKHCRLISVYCIVLSFASRYLTKIFNVQIFLSFYLCMVLCVCMWLWLLF